LTFMMRPVPLTFYNNIVYYYMIDDTLRDYYSQWFREYQCGLILLRDEFIKSAPRDKQYIYAAGKYCVDRIQKENAPQKKGGSFYWVTISPPHDINLSDFKVMIERVTKLSFMKNPIYALEQTGTTNETLGYHMHCHMIVPKVVNISPADIKRRLVRTTKSIVDCKVFTDDYKEDKILYLQGKKWDEDKDEAIKYTEIWRAKNDIKNIYGI